MFQGRTHLSEGRGKRPSGRARGRPAGRKASRTDSVHVAHGVVQSVYPLSLRNPQLHLDTWRGCSRLLQQRLNHGSRSIRHFTESLKPPRLTAREGPARSKPSEFGAITGIAKAQIWNVYVKARKIPDCERKLCYGAVKIAMMHQPPSGVGSRDSRGFPFDPWQPRVC